MAFDEALLDSIEFAVPLQALDCADDAAGGVTTVA
jgi:hypothetical protein